MKLHTRIARRGTAAGLAGVLVAGAFAGLTASPAHAADVATGLTWNVSEQWQTHLGVQTPGDGATYDAAAKTANFPLVGATRASDGVVTVSYAGSLNGAFGFNGNTLYSVTIAEPTLVIEPDGDGHLSATVSSTGTRSNPTVPFPADGPATVKVADFTGGVREGASFTATPAWEGVLPAGSQQAADLGVPAGFPVDGKSFNPAFLGAIHPDVRSTFYWSGVSEASNLRKAPGAIKAQVPPTVETSVVSASWKDGVQVKVAGKGFDAGTVGVYAVLAPADSVIDPDDRDGMAKFQTSYVMPQDFTGDSFVTVVSAHTDQLQVGKDYAIFTLRAHGLPDRSQDTKTPVTIDWSKLAAPKPVKKVAKTAVKVNKKATRKKAGKATVAITGAKAKATGRAVVTLRIPGIKKARVLKPKLNKQGKATVKLPKAKKKGKYSIVVTYKGDKNYKAAKKKTVSFKVK